MQVRQKLGVPDGVKLVLITMGGIPERYMFLDSLAHQSDTYFVIPGGSQTMQLLIIWYYYPDTLIFSTLTLSMLVMP